MGWTGDEIESRLIAMRSALKVEREMLISCGDVQDAVFLLKHCVSV